MLSNYWNYWISDPSFSTKLEISQGKNQLLKDFLFIKKSIQNLSFSCWKDPDTGKDWRQEKKGTTVDETIGWHHQPNEHAWVWVNSGSWWWTGRPGILQPMGSQRVRHNWVTELINRILLLSWCVSCFLPQSELKLISVRSISSTLLLGMYVCVCVCVLGFERLDKTEKETQMYRTNFKGGMFWENNTETRIVSRVK